MPNCSVCSLHCASIRLCVCDRILKVCEHSILQSTHGNFTRFAPQLQLGTAVKRLLDFEVKILKINVTVRSYEHFGGHFLTYLRNAWMYVN